MLIQAANRQELIKIIRTHRWLLSFQRKENNSQIGVGLCVFLLVQDLYIVGQEAVVFSVSFLYSGKTRGSENSARQPKPGRIVS